MKKFLILIILAQALLLAPKALAVTPAECIQECYTRTGNSYQCAIDCGGDPRGPVQNETLKLFGILEPPQNVEAYSADTAGLIRLLSNVLKISVVAAGIFGLINLVVSGIQWAAAAGNPEMIKQASSRIWMSLLGLVIVAGAFVLAGVIGLLFFGSATAIINPVIYGPK